MKRSGLVVLLVLFTCASVLAIPAFAGTGSIRIDPPLPGGSESPAVFEIWTQGKTMASDLHIFLVMTESCYSGLTDVEVSWLGGSVIIPKGDDWTKETVNSVKVPPGTTNGAGYTVASLKDHLETSEPIYWAFVDLWDDPPLNKIKKTITVTLSSSDPEMLVYILGKSGCSDLFDMRVPPTIPGFVVPEIPLGTASAVLSMLGALGYYLRSREV